MPGHAFFDPLLALPTAGGSLNKALPGSRNGFSPSLMRGGAEHLERLSAGQVPLRVEGVEDGGVNSE